MDSDKPVCAPDLPLAPHVHACDLAILLNHMLVSWACVDTLNLVILLVSLRDPQKLM